MKCLRLYAGGMVKGVAVMLKDGEAKILDAQTLETAVEVLRLISALPVEVQERYYYMIKGTLMVTGNMS